MKPSYILSAFLLAVISCNALNAEEIVTFTCVTSNASPDAVSRLADEVMSDHEAGEQEPSSLQSIVDTIATCIETESISEEMHERYLEGAILTLTEAELRGRLSATGFDMKLAQELVSVMGDGQSVDVAEYIDARPETFKAEVERVAAITEFSMLEIAGLIGAYVGISDLQNRYGSVAPASD
ncbi:MAG: hypothetical protein AAFQ27_06115 [Pseudomonadota bacterium]